MAASTNKADFSAYPIMTVAEMRRRGIDKPDFVYVSGDAYIDHPSFGTAIITRVLESRGYTVGIIAQPDWKDPDSVKIFGAPRLAFLVSAGNLDSMVNHYTVAKKHRSDDSYTPGGKSGARPDRAVIVYGNLVRRAYPHVPVVIGGIEASLRRFAHYDYWDDRVRHSVLYDSGADILSYGMGEHSIIAIADALNEGRPVREIRDIRGTCYRVSNSDELPEGHVMLPSYTEVASDKTVYAEAFRAIYAEQDAITGKILVQPHEKGFLVANPPAMPLSEKEMDAVYALPFRRKPHPIYKDHIPALDEIAFSVTSVRGCYGGCSFCALTFHQGRVVQKRSHESILGEIRALTKDPDFKGYIHDVGGPTANFRDPACRKQCTKGVCRDRQCIGYKPCPNLTVSHRDYLELLRKARRIPGVKKVFVRSGVRFDYVLLDKDKTFLKELVEHHVSGQLKTAPEHISDRVLYYMNKPPREVYERFEQTYRALNKAEGKEQYIVPYLMSSHPGAGLSEAIELAVFLKERNLRPQQVQDFYPTPGTLSTAMYHTGLDPRTMKPVYVAKTEDEKRMQRALMQYFLPKNFGIIRKALKKAGRDDLIGGRKGLVPEERTEPQRNVREGGVPARRTQTSAKGNAGPRGKENKKRQQNKQTKPKTGRALQRGR
ncbi:MAG: YgiQ family radical SAM protein [Clostridia bacterium]|nr:YgiQ family radical SAM protein [Clostridia bacterium]